MNSTLLSFNDPAVLKACSYHYIRVNIIIPPIIPPIYAALHHLNASVVRLDVVVAGGVVLAEVLLAGDDRALVVSPTVLGYVSLPILVVEVVSKHMPLQHAVGATELGAEGAVVLPLEFASPLRLGNDSGLLGDLLLLKGCCLGDDPFRVVSPVLHREAVGHVIACTLEVELHAVK